MRRAEIIEREQRWARPAAIATMAGAALVVGGGVLLGLAVGGDTDAERLRAVDDDPAGFLAATIVRALGLALLAVPLAYLFNAAAARSVGMRRQLIGLTVAGPLFIAISTALSGFALAESASEFVSRGLAGRETEELAEDLTGEGTFLRNLAFGFSFGGAIGFTVAMVYTCLHAMRTGLLTRFWGSLGMALGAVSLLFLQFTVIWFIYAGLLFAGWVPGGRPRAWETGEAVPWPAPGEAQSKPSDESEAGEEGEAGEPAGEEGGSPPSGPTPPSGGARSRKKKRKRRS